MRTPRLLLTWFLLLGVATLLSGCFTFGEPKSRRGSCVDNLYEPMPKLLRERGKIAATFSATSRACPPTEWRIFANNYKSDWMPVRRYGKPRSIERPAEPHGIEFRMYPTRSKLPSCDVPPEPRIVSILERQRVTVMIEYR